MSTSSEEQTNNSLFTLQSLFPVSSRVALITGGGSGIGLMATQALAVNGCKVYITGRDASKLDRVVQTHGQNISGSIIPLPGFDITTKENINALVSELSSRESHLDILINNAGIAGPTHETSTDNASDSSQSALAAEMKKNLYDDKDNTFDAWSSVYTTNASAVFFLSTACLPLLAASTEKQHGWSSCIINIASISATVRSAQHHFQYNASKAATLQLTKLLSSEFASSGVKVRVNAISPGVFPSEMTAEKGESGGDQKSEIPKGKFEGKVPADRPGRDQDMGAAVLFLATNQYVNGAEVVVDGGYLIKEGR